MGSRWISCSFYCSVVRIWNYLRRACQTISRHVRDERFANRLRQAQTREQVTALLEEADQGVP